EFRRVLFRSFRGLDQQPLVEFEKAAAERERVAGAQLDHGGDHVGGGVRAGLYLEHAAFAEGRRRVGIAAVAARVTTAATPTAAGGQQGGTCGAERREKHETGIGWHGHCSPFGFVVLVRLYNPGV